jgi:hypothetical protein
MNNTTSHDWLAALVSNESRFEVWQKRGFCNNTDLVVLVAGRKRFDANTKKRITKRWLESRYIKKG